jgi:hypothetical protein
LPASPESQGQNLTTDNTDQKKAKTLPRIRKDRVIWRSGDPVIGKAEADH